jgi:hypothetical protein
MRRQEAVVREQVDLGEGVGRVRLREGLEDEVSREVTALGSTSVLLLMLLAVLGLPGARGPVA